jgi:hypothetical protein
MKKLRHAMAVETAEAPRAAGCRAEERSKPPTFLNISPKCQVLVYLLGDDMTFIRSSFVDL